MKKILFVVSLFLSLGLAPVASAQTAEFDILARNWSSLSQQIPEGEYITFRASFTISIRAVDGDITFQSNESDRPFIGVDDFAVYLNGARAFPENRDAYFFSSGPDAIWHDQFSFTIPENVVKTFEVTFLFNPDEINPLGPRYYGVSILGSTWSAGGQDYRTTLGGPNWSVGSVPTAIPEPSTYALWAGVAALGLIRARKRKQSR